MATIKDFNELRRKLTGLEKKADQIIQVTILQFANKMFAEAMSNLGHPALAGTFSLNVEEGGYKISISTTSNIAAYIEFGTGNYAAEYLAGQPSEVSAEAIKFYISGDGTMPARPYLFPAYFKYRDQVMPEINRRLERLFRNF